MSGAEGLSLEDNVLLNAVGSRFARDLPLSYAFVPAGEAVEKSTYTGGSDVTRAWTAQEQADFRTHIAVFTEVAQISFQEVGFGSDPDVFLQMVDDVPGGFSGYAGGSIFVVGSADEELIVHEFGHSLSLAHPFDTSYSTSLLPGVVNSTSAGDFGFNAELYTVMAYRAGSLLEYPDVDVASPNSLQPLDIAALQVMYGTNATTRTGNDLYGLTDTFSTIWDAGGQDTISFEGSLQDTAIDLRAASLRFEEGGLGRPSLMDTSDMAEDVGGYLIAYGVTIEDAVGGFGNDRITGNDAANHLQGGQGDDTLIGGIGDDLIEGGVGALQTIDLAILNDANVQSRSLEANIQDMPGSITIDLVLEMKDSPEAFQRILSYRPDDASDFGFDIQYFGGASDFLGLIYRTDDGFRALSVGIVGGDLINAGLIRLTIMRDQTSGEFQFYLNGDFRGSRVIEEGRAVASGGTLAFGQSLGVWTEAGSSSSAYRGNIGDIAIYDGVLSAADIAGRGPLDPVDLSDPRLATYWRADAADNGYDTVRGTATLGLQNGATVQPVAYSSDNDMLIGGVGDDTFGGGAGEDTVSIAASQTEVAVAERDGLLYVASRDGLDAVRGDIERIAFDDGTLSRSAVAALSNGAELRLGAGGNESLSGTLAAEVIGGLAGSDWITPGGGNDTVFGGAGNDMVSFVGLAETPGRTNIDFRLIVDLEAGTARSHDGAEETVLYDVERVTGTIFADNIRGDADANQLRGAGDYDWFTATAGGDTIDGGNGLDMITFLEAASSGAPVVQDIFATDGMPPTGASVGGVLLDLADGSNNTGLAAGLTLISVERVTGSSHQDVFFGDGEQNDFRGLGGFDWFVSSTGGRERYFGGDGIDTVTYFNAGSGVIASLRNGTGEFGGQETGFGSAGDATRDLYFEIENLVGSDFDDRLEGNRERNDLVGRDGDDYLLGYGNIDYLKGGLGNDTLDGGAGSDFALFDGNRRDYTLTRTSSTEVTIVGADGTDSLINVEYFQFDDQTANIWELSIA